MDISIALERELEQTQNFEEKTRVLSRYIGILIKHKFITKNEATSLAFITYRGLVEVRFLNRLLNDFSEFDVDADNAEEELRMRMFTRALRLIILTLLDMFEDWSHRAIVYKRFIELLKRVWPISEHEYRLAFYHEERIYNSMDGRSLLLILAEMAPQFTDMSSEQFMSSIIQLIKADEFLSDTVEHTVFDVTMMRELK